MMAAGFVAALAAAPAHAEFGDLLSTLYPTDFTTLFGSSVSLSGSTALIGTEFSRDTAGSAYLFDVTTGQQLRRLAASDGAPGDDFGKDVAILGNTALVGAWQAIVGNQTNGKGKAYLFDVSTGQELFKLTASDAAPYYDVFGNGVALIGNRAIVTAPSFSETQQAEYGMPHPGAAYVFDVATGLQLLKYTPSDGVPGDRFGGTVGQGSIAVSGDIAIGGARYKNDGGITDSGAAYLFDVTTGKELFKLLPSDPSDRNYFGHDVAISGNRALVGASQQFASLGLGAAYLFDITTGQQLFKFTPSSTTYATFGWSVALNSTTAIVGARDEGAAYLFDLETGQLLKKLTGPNDSHFGGSVAINNNFAVVGARGENGFQGAAYVFDISRGPALPGDFNNDRTVDAADYAVWRNGLDTTYTQTDYDTWRANFGRSAANVTSGATAGMARGPVSAQIPESSALALIATAAVPLLCRRRGKRKPIRSREQLTNSGKNFVEHAR
jgi:hypothetical protein